MKSKAWKKKANEVASQAFLEAPMELLASDALLDLCANAAIQVWYRRYISSYRSNRGAHPGLKLFFNTIVRPV